MHVRKHASSPQVTHCVLAHASSLTTISLFSGLQTHHSSFSSSNECDKSSAALRSIASWVLQKAGAERDSGMLRVYWWGAPMKGEGQNQDWAEGSWQSAMMIWKISVYLVGGLSKGCPLEQPHIGQTWPALSASTLFNCWCGPPQDWCEKANSWRLSTNQFFCSWAVSTFLMGHLNDASSYLPQEVNTCSSFHSSSLKLISFHPIDCQFH